MLYSEFIEGTGCKDNEKNYKVYKDLEIMYMNSNMSKSEIYEYGKKLVDNSKTEKELQLEQEIKEQIDECKEFIKANKYWVDYHTQMARIYKENGEKERYRHQRDMAQSHKAEIRRLKDMIRFLKIA